MLHIRVVLVCCLLTTRLMEHEDQEHWHQTYLGSASSYDITLSKPLEISEPHQLRGVLFNSEGHQED